MTFGFKTAELNFEPLEEVGQEGKNSKVFRSHDKQLDAVIVTKHIEITKFVNPDDFFNEAKKLYDSSHPNVVPIKYACKDTDHIFLAMPFYKNGSLKKLIDSRTLTVREILRYSIQFLTGLNHIHVNNLIHFDIKPDNILISDSDEALVADFGLTKNMNNFGMSGIDQVYNFQAPPDAYQQTQHSNVYDIYMAGVTIYRMCNGNNVFYNQVRKYPTTDDLKQAITSGAFPDRRDYLPHIPKKLRTVVNKAMRVDQTTRHQTVLELINELSVIDSLLDWNFDTGQSGIEWTLDLDDKTFQVSLKINNAIAEIESSKTMKGNGNKQRVTSGCKKNVALKDIDGTIQSILLELES